MYEIHINMIFTLSEYLSYDIDEHDAQKIAMVAVMLLTILCMSLNHLKIKNTLSAQEELITCLTKRIDAVSESIRSPSPKTPIRISTSDRPVAVRMKKSFHVFRRFLKHLCDTPTDSYLDKHVTIYEPDDDPTQGEIFYGLRDELLGADVDTDQIQVTLEELLAHMPKTIAGATAVWSLLDSNTRHELVTYWRPKDQ